MDETFSLKKALRGSPHIPFAVTKHDPLSTEEKQKLEKLTFRYADIVSKLPFLEQSAIVCDRVECIEDPTIYVELVAEEREGGLWFVLNMDQIKIGFQTAAYYKDAIYERLNDGTKVWHIGIIGCNVFHFDHKNNTVKYFNNTNYFSSKAQQEKAMILFAMAMTKYDGNPTKSREGTAKAIVVYTPELMEKVERREFIR